MKHFFRIAIIVAAVFLCCGCRRDGSNVHEGILSGLDGSDGQGVAQGWQYVDTAMGTVIQQTVYAPEETANLFFEGAMTLLSKLEQEELSWRLESSEVARINASAGSEEGCRISGEMASLLEDCLELYEHSEGAFDVTLGPLTRIWNIDKWAADQEADGFQLPTQEEVGQALRLCGSDRIQLVYDGFMAEENFSATDGNGEFAEGRVLSAERTKLSGKEDAEASGKSDGRGEARIFLPEGMQLDLGAVGKGLAQSRLLRLLEEETELTGAVISLGGSILTFGSKPDGSAWKVGIVNPFDPSSNIGILSLEGQWCVSTSGDYERYVEKDGVRYHHILDPATGYPASGDVRGVTILAKEGQLSDGLSTACFLLGSERGMELAAEYGAEALFVLSDGRIVLSEGMESLFAP